MANFMKGIDFGNKKPGVNTDADMPDFNIVDPSNPGAPWNETWAHDKSFYSFDHTKSRYGLEDDSLISKIGKDRMSKYSDYRRAKIENRSEILDARKAQDLKRQEDRLIAAQGSKLSKRQLRLLGKNKFDKAMKIAERKNRFRNFFNR